VAAGSSHSLALTSSGAIKAWGYDASGQVSGKPSDSGYIRIAAGQEFSMALRPDGTIVSWGSGSQVASTPAEPGFVDIAGGAFHAVALRSDGTIVSWGSDSFGQIATSPQGGGFVDVSAGSNHSLALSSSRPFLTATNFVGGQFANLQVANAFRFSPVILAYSVSGAGPISTPYGLVRLSPPFFFLPQLVTNGSGVALLSAPLPPFPGFTIYLQALDLVSGNLTQGISPTIL